MQLACKGHVTEVFSCTFVLHLCFVPVQGRDEESNAEVHFLSFCPELSLHPKTRTLCSPLHSEIMFLRSKRTVPVGFGMPGRRPGGLQDDPIENTQSPAPPSPPAAQPDLDAADPIEEIEDDKLLPP